MITLEGLIQTMNTKLAEIHQGDLLRQITDRNWARICGQLVPHIEEFPAGPFYLDEFGNEVQDYEEVEVGGRADTIDEDLAMMCWELGCSVSYCVSYYTGEISYEISLPETEEEYQDNLSAYKAWETENYCTET